MSAGDTLFDGSIPAIYEQCLVPLLFQPYADDLARRVGALAPARVLETAAGTGVVTKAIAQALPPEARIVATDLNEAMLQVASRGTHAPAITWQPADAQGLPFADTAFDVVVCQFGVMFMPDKAAAYREARRVLRPGGAFVFNVWDALDYNEVSLLVAKTVAAHFPGDPPRFIERTPFGYHDAARIRDELESAGFQHVTIEPVGKVTEAPSPDVAAKGICQGTPLRGEIESRSSGRLEEVTALATDALARRFGRGAFENRMRALVVAAVRE